MIEMRSNGTNYKNLNFMEELETESFFEEQLRFTGIECGVDKKHRLALQKHINIIERGKKC